MAEPIDKKPRNTEKVNFLIFRMANFIVAQLRFRKRKLNLLSRKMMKEKLIANFNELINRVKNFHQILNRSLHQIFRKILLISVKGLAEMIEERREDITKVEIKKIEDKIIREMIVKEDQRIARRRKEVFKASLEKIKTKDVRRDQEKNKTPPKSPRELMNKSVNTRKRKRGSNKKESNGWRNIKRIDKIKTIKKALKILSLKIKIESKETIVHKEEMKDRENVNKEEKKDLHAMMKMMMMKNYQEDPKELNRENHLNNQRERDNKEMDHQKEEVRNIKKTDKDMEVLIEIQRIEDKEMMKCLLKMIQSDKSSLRNHLLASDQSHD
jgi:hypothetical protein